MPRYKPPSIRFVIPDKDDSSTWESIGWTPNMVDKNYPLVHMSPTEFLRLVDPAFNRQSPYFCPESYTWLEQAVLEKRAFAPLMVNKSAERSGGVLPHEGRHRAYLARVLGMDQVPVYLMG